MGFHDEGLAFTYIFSRVQAVLPSCSLSLLGALFSLPRDRSFLVVDVRCTTSSRGAGGFQMSLSSMSMREAATSRFSPLGERVPSCGICSLASCRLGLERHRGWRAFWSRHRTSGACWAGIKARLMCCVPCIVGHGNISTVYPGSLY